MSQSLNPNDVLAADAVAGHYVPLAAVAARAGVSVAELPYACRVFAENLERGRLCDANIGNDDVLAMLHWRDHRGVGVPLSIGRVILPDSSGLPVLLDLASLRDAVAEAGCDPAGVEPRIMGIGPAPATQKLCARLGLKPSQFDVIELNEAFASQGIAVLRQLGIAEDAAHVNPNGGAIALGHPLGMSGARISGTAALELRERGGRYALATMCIGVGQGIAIALERV